MAEWHYLVGETQHGPVSTTMLRELAAKGELAPTDMIWKDGLADWVPAARVKGLFPAASAPAAAPVMTEQRAPVEEEAPPPPESEPESAQPTETYETENESTESSEWSEAPAEEAAEAPIVQSFVAPPFQMTPSTPSAPQAVISYHSYGEGGAVSAGAIEMLRQTKPWVRFLSILGFISCGLVVLGSIAMLVGMSMSRGRGAGGIDGMIGLVYLAMGALYFFPALYLSRYASRIGQLMSTQRSTQLEQALEAQKSFWRFVGILTVIVIGVYVIVIALVVLRVLR